jgi:anti-sigma factor RsiW
MTCRKARKALPLLAGGDLPPRKERKVLAHLQGCSTCREELAEYERALGRVKAAARQEGVKDWTREEWQALMAGIAASKTGRRAPAFGLRSRWALATGLAAVVVLAATVVFFKHGAFRPQETAPVPGPDVVSVTMVSRETGLQVVWFLNKNFDWKGDQK